MKLAPHLLFFALSVLLPWQLAFAEDRPPNVVLIVVDDLGYADLSCTGLADDVETPNIDRLAQEGLRFTEAYATALICNASRIAIMTGCYQQRQGTEWYAGKGLHRPDIPTIAEHLRGHGYATGYIGKFHHGSLDRPGKRGFPLEHGFDTFFGFSGGTKHYLHHAAKYQEAGKDRMYQGPMWVEDQKQDIEGFTTELFGERARDFIQQHAEGPFYLHLSFNAVHNYTHQLPADYLEAHDIEPFADIAPGEDLWAWRGKISYPEHPHGRDYYLGQLHFLDFEIGRLLDQLETSQLLEDTLILFVSDNGGSLVTYANNGPLKGGKYTLYEGGTRVPLIIRAPDNVGDASAGQTTDQIASTLDLFPTICSLTDTPPPAGLDGITLAPLIQKPASETADWDRPAPLYWHTGSESAIRSGKWKLLQTRKAPYPKIQIEPTPTGTFLYDLSQDEGEAKDLAANHPEIVETLEQQLEAWKAQMAAEGKK